LSISCSIAEEKENQKLICSGRLLHQYQSKSENHEKIVIYYLQCHYTVGVFRRTLNELGVIFAKQGNLL
jgi:hypothetical protein